MGTQDRTAGGRLVEYLARRHFTFEDEDLQGAFLACREIASVVGISLEAGAVRLALIGEADAIADDRLLGDFFLVHGKLTEFRRHGMPVLKTRVGDVTQGIRAHVFLVFNRPGQAEHFLEHLLERCRHVTFWRKVCTLPWVIDVPGQRVLRWRGWPPCRGLNQAELAGHLFAER